MQWVFNPKWFAILGFDDKIINMQEDDYLVPLFQICMVSTCVPLIILLTDHQDKLALQQIEKFNRFKWGEEMSQFKVGYIIFTGIKQQNTLPEQVQK